MLSASNQFHTDKWFSPMILITAWSLNNRNFQFQGCAKFISCGEKCKRFLLCFWHEKNFITCHVAWFNDGWLKVGVELHCNVSLLFEYTTTISNWIFDWELSHKLHWEASLVVDYLDRKSTRLNSSHVKRSRMPSSAWKKKKYVLNTSRPFISFMLMLSFSWLM